MAGWLWFRRSKTARQENKGTSTSQEQKQVQTKNRNKNNTFQSDTPAGRRIVRSYTTWLLDVTYIGDYELIHIRETGFNQLVQWDGMGSEYF